MYLKYGTVLLYFWFREMAYHCATSGHKNTGVVICLWDISGMPCGARFHGGISGGISKGDSNFHVPYFSSVLRIRDPG